MAQQNVSNVNNDGSFGNKLSGGTNQFGGQGNATRNGDTFNTNIKDAANFLSTGKFEAGTVQIHYGSQGTKTERTVKGLKEMNVEDVVQMLKEIQLETYEKVFRDNGIDGPTLIELLVPGGLEELGITSEVHQAKLRGKVQTIKDIAQ